MGQTIKSRYRLNHARGFAAALDLLRCGLAQIPDGQLQPAAAAFREDLFNWIDEWMPDEDFLRVQPTNAELARRYAISARTVTNWRRDGCPFEDGQWRVLDWVADKRIIPAGVKGKFMRQLERRGRLGGRIADVWE